MPGPTDLEQLLLEYINDARLDPVGDALRYIRAFGTPATSADASINSALQYFGVSGPAYLAALQGLTPVQPVAWNEQLATAARTHDQAMIAADSQSHQLPGEPDVGARITNAGYSWTSYGENIYAFALSPLYAQAGFMVDWGTGPGGMQAGAGHRVNIMGSYFREVGVGIVLDGSSATQVGPEVVTEDFATRQGVGPLVLGVAYTDADHDDFYSLGEGLASLAVSAGLQSTTSTTSGGYTLATGFAGTQTLTFSGAGLASAVTATVTLGTSSNVKIDIVNGSELKSSADVVVSGPISLLEAIGAGAVALTATGGAAHTLLGAGGDNRLTGGSGNDVLDGGGGADVMAGGAGNDVYIVDAGVDQVIEAAGQGQDTVFARVSYALAAGQEVEVLSTISAAAADAIDLSGNEFGQTLVGNAGRNVLSGGGGADVLDGREGDDLLDGGAGADAMFGGAGNDNYLVDNAGDQAIEAAGAGYDAVFASVSWAMGAGQSIETLAAIDQSATTAINLTGNELANTLVGNAGANVLDGGGGADLLIGRGGNDVYVVDHAADQVIENAGEGYDTVFTAVSWAIAAGQSVEVLSVIDAGATVPLNLTGNELANTLLGNAGANVMNGGAGADVMVGRGGDDTYVVDDGGDQVFENAGEGQDTVLSSISYALLAGQSVEVLATVDSTATTAINLYGNELANTVIGNAGNNVLSGGDGDDVLFGLAGNDILYGGAGNDVLVTGSGQDIAIGGDGYDSLVLAGTRSSWQVQLSGGQYYLSNGGDRVQVQSIEAVVFADQTVGWGTIAAAAGSDGGLHGFADTREPADAAAMPDSGAAFGHALQPLVAIELVLG